MTAMKAKMCNSPLPKQKHPCFDSCPVSEKQNIHTPLLLHIFHTNLCMYNIYIYFLNMLHIKKDYGTLQNTCLTKIITPQMFENYTKPLHNVTLLNQHTGLKNPQTPRQIFLLQSSLRSPAHDGTLSTNAGKINYTFVVVVMVLFIRKTCGPTSGF